jgi:hypothetical protein
MTGTVKNVPVNTILLQSLGDLVSVLTAAGIVICILILARRVAAGTPFARASVRALISLAVVIVIGFEGATALRGMGEISVTSVLFAAPDQPDGLYSPPATFIPLLTLWPIYIAAALLALAAVFGTGGRFQADTNGLV